MTTRTDETTADEPAGNLRGEGPAPAPSPWGAYWDTLEARQEIFTSEAKEFVRRLDRAIGIDPRMRVLDFGSGFGHVAFHLAPRVAEYYPWDASAAMRQRTDRILAGLSNIRHWDFSDPRGDEGLPLFDVVLVNSVVQYMSGGEFADWLVRWRRLLAPGGRVILSDIIPQGRSTWKDWWDLLWFCGRRGFLLAAVLDGVREIHRYRAMKRYSPLRRFAFEDIAIAADRVGYFRTVLGHNLTYRNGRWTFILTANPWPSRASS